MLCVRVKLFGEAREAVGSSSVLLRLSPATSSDLLPENGNGYPGSSDEEKAEERNRQETHLQRSLKLSREEFLSQLARQFPALGKILPTCRLALDHSLVEDAGKTQKEEEREGSVESSPASEGSAQTFLELSSRSYLALLPPVSGG